MQTASCALIERLNSPGASATGFGYPILSLYTLHTEKLWAIGIPSVKLPYSAPYTDTRAAAGVCIALIKTAAGYNSPGHSNSTVPVLSICVYIYIYIYIYVSLYI